MITNRCLCTIPIFAIALSLTLHPSHAAIQTEIILTPTNIGGPPEVLLSPENKLMDAALPARADVSLQSDLRSYMVDASQQIRLVEHFVNSTDGLPPAPYAVSVRGEGLADVVADLYLTHVAVLPPASSAAVAGAPKSAAPTRKNADASMVANAYTFNSHVAPDGPNSHTWKPVKVYSLPEVSSLTLLAIGSVGLIMRRKKHT